MYIASVDPGSLSGRIVINEIVDSKFLPRQVFKIPCFSVPVEVTKANKSTNSKYKAIENRNIVDSYKLAQYVSKISDITNVVALENYEVIGFLKDKKTGKQKPRNPAIEALTLSNWGKIRAVLEIYKMTIIPVKSKTWKTKFGLQGGTENKYQSVEKCIELFGYDITHVVLKQEHNACESALLGYHAYKHTTGIHTLFSQKEAS